MRQSFPKKVASKSFDCLVEPDLSVKLPHSRGCRDVKAHYTDKTNKEVLMESPKHNSFPAGAPPEWFTSGKARFERCLVFHTCWGCCEKETTRGPGLLRSGLRAVSEAWGQQRTSRDYSVRQQKNNGMIRIFSKPFSTQTTSR